MFIKRYKCFVDGFKESVSHTFLFEFYSLFKQGVQREASGGLESGVILGQHLGPCESYAGLDAAPFSLSSSFACVPLSVKEL